MARIARKRTVSVGLKYRNKKVEVNGIVFDSKREAKRYQELSLLLQAGAISNLRMQVKYVLIPAQYEYKWNADKNKTEKKCVERECSYIADFVYWDNELEDTVVEDTKGFKTKDYIIKRKLMLHVYGTKIKEV